MHAETPAPDRDRELVLYQADYCPFCRRVTRALTELELGGAVEVRDTLEKGHREALAALTGRTQIPCLVIDGVPLLESLDIIQWLQDYAQREDT